MLPTACFTAGSAPSQLLHHPPQQPCDRTLRTGSSLARSSSRALRTGSATAAALLCIHLRRTAGRGRTCRRATSAAASEEDARLLENVIRECREVVVLQQADKETIGDLIKTMTELKVPAGETVVKQGDQIDSMYVIVEGELQMARSASEDEMPVLKPARRGDQFGAVTLLGNTPQKDTIVAKTDCRLWRLDREAFDKVILADQDDDDEDEDEDEDDDGEICTASSLREIYVVSDSTGESANASVRAALRQFDYCFGSTCGTARSTVYRFVRTVKEAEAIVELARKRKALVVYTVMTPKVHDAIAAACKEKGVEACDLWESLLATLEKKFGAKRSGVFGRRQPVSEEYMKIVRAIEYTRKVDDGVLPHLWDEADIMLVGPSRAGKTPLAFYLAQRGFKVANYPLVPDEDPPPELFTIDQKKCIGLFIQPERLQAIRKERMAQFKRSSTNYASLDKIQKEVRWIKTFYLRNGSGWPIIDTTNSGVQETAARITEIFDRRKGDVLAAAYVSTLTD